MKNAKITTQQLALFIGQKCQTPVGPGTIDAVSVDRVRVGDGRGGQILPPEDVTLILRPVTDMAEDEARQVYRLDEGKDFVVYDWMDDELTPCLDYLLMEDEFYIQNLSMLIGNPNVLLFLCASSFDIFGWIPAGLAIDATKTKTEI